MRDWVEGLAALGVVILLGGALWLFSGDAPGAADGGATVSFDAEAAARGQNVASGTGCLACHSIDGTEGTGPSWSGVAGTERPLDDGESVIADDAYLFNSIVDPEAQIVAGYEAVMPTTYSESLGQAEIDDLVEYIKSLS